MKSLRGRFGQGSRQAATLAAGALVIATTSAFAVAPAATHPVATHPAATHPVATHPVAWGRPFLIDKLALTGLQSVSCSGPKFCAAVDGSGNAFTFNGVSWKSYKDVDSNTGGLWSVSCSAATFCLASDQDGFAIKWNGRRWSPPRQFDFNIDQPSLPRLSCVTSTFCAAVDEFGLALVWHGRGWSHRLIASPTGSVDLQGLSCLRTKFCLAVGTGFTTTWNGTTWSKPRAVDNGGGLLAVSCTSTTF